MALLWLSTCQDEGNRQRTHPFVKLIVKMESIEGFNAFTHRRCEDGERGGVGDK
jgi:hypothetical protein